MSLSLETLTLLLLVTQTRAEVFPSSYSFSATEAVSVNGSSFNQKCFGISLRGGMGYTCTQPTTSVLFDGNIPTLNIHWTAEDMWASQLLTLQNTGSQVQLHFNFTGTPDYTGVGKVEVVMFNCPEWGIAAQTIGIFGVPSSTQDCSSLLGISHPTLTSCDSLVSVCIPLDTTLPLLSLQFFLRPDANWVHLAEVVFSNRSTSQCPLQVYTTARTTQPQTTTPYVSSEVRNLTEAMSPTGSDITTSNRTEMCPSCTMQCEVCSSSQNEVHPSCTTSAALATVITAIGTALLATVIFVLVQIAVCKCHPKFTSVKGVETTEVLEGDTGQEYEQMDTVEGGIIALSDPTYMEVVGGGGAGNAFQLKENEAYGEINTV